MIAGHSLCPPSTTRAAVRGRCIEKFGSAVQATQWDYILLKGAHKKIELDLRNLFDASLVKESLKIIGAAKTVEDLAQLKFAKIV
jgi:proteasome accessory factor A